MNNTPDPKKNQTPPRDDFRVAPSVKPFTRYRAIELAICGVAVILGLLYLYAHVLTLTILLPCYALFFLCIPILRILDARALGEKGTLAVIPIVFWFILAIAVIVATVSYFVNM